MERVLGTVPCRWLLLRLSGLADGLLQGMGMGNESDQVTEGHLVDALALRGDEGRGTLR